MTNHVCKCKRGYASPVDHKCRKCRTKREQSQFDQRREAYAKGYEAGEQYPNIQDIACPYRTTHQREGWIEGRNDAVQ